ncbi:MAG: helix-hairpin-helix domain-containing protein [Chlorobium sp.]|uniref:ComEA family DNA-binding protein n=1 Tax=Chlorobium sp. TaxID=1095 RepID=UPI0025C515BF|nr:helix-hairpin-helix domain-containing protein [Chlorobium sp.]MCF8215309.1 helix-hairpin-helix domain-containing protein [Chlorobium sp.]MCF8270146.1 helix-hairpin-helix domain-containing protein [Chlorobium sp.]MCF8286516.1 helix-hairpin-helix domain-containing protein [Chlorobium sp.]MCF8290114.1 helix-hairpin-helix domain-containing protein [Chlorobium sp.]MCF8384186.1 helix-hairpin-helix domain-containing protein [Chlorobium sp.]
MNILDRLAVRLSLTKAEISVISLLVLFLMLGGAVRNFRTAHDAESLLKEKEEEQYSDRDTDSMLAAASIFTAERPKTSFSDAPAPMSFSGEQAGSAVAEEKPFRERAKKSRTGRKVFNGTLAFNKATEQQLQQIPGVGPVMAKRLVSFRSSKGGRIERHEDLLQVNGIGEKKLEILKKHLTLE